MALSTTETVADPRSARAVSWQADLRDAAISLVGQLAAERSEG
jgi:hypothetical protein